MKIQDKVRFEHISEAILEIESYVKGISEGDFVRNSLIRSATVRQFEIIGEAVKAISEELQGQYPKIPWRLWANFRNVLIHQYFGVDYEEVYKTVQNDLPTLKRQIDEILSKA
ncbi:MAG: DUF86 domain-containing protein [Desulfobacterales bacterium]|nr:DUF86 domain-containing protein [Desulfobacterales bacterium]MBF0398675.1 DUF86 domain-containing protein [Desulfobacterales bacterium]